MGTWWSGLSEGQGSVLAALITVIAAGIGVLLGWTLFSSRVLTLQDAVNKAKEHLEQYRKDMDTALDGVRRDLDQRKRYGREVNSSVGDLQSATFAAVNPQEAADKVAQREAIQQDWYAIRDRIEEAATAEDLSEELRARYAQFDRRRGYGPLIEALGQDGKLGERTIRFLEAAGLWAKYRSGRATPTADDVGRMDDLRVVLTQG